MTLPDYPDWTQPVALAERVSLLTTPGQTVTPGGGSVSVPTADVASVAVVISIPNSVAGNRYYLRMNWQVGAVVVDYQAISFHDASSYLFPMGTIIVQAPARATSLVLSLAGAATGPMALSVYGSTRQVNDLAVTRPTSNSNRELASVAGLNVPASSTSAVRYVPPATGRIRFLADINVSKMTFRIMGVTEFGAPASVPLVTASPDGVNQLTFEFYAPQLALEWTVQNSDTVAHAFNGNFWDVS